MKRTGYLMVISFFLLTNCTEKPPLSGRIEPDTSNKWTRQVYLIQPNSLDEVAASFVGEVIDSAAIKPDGSFAFTKLPDSPDPILLELVVQQKGERYLNRLNNEDPTIANYFPFVWKNGLQIEFTATLDQFQSSLSFKNLLPKTQPC